ncbi:3-hydroxyacyl-CoA dehydrogenase NAD-binding domain-containing protein [Aurantimonas sp. Leaf443]|uniref:3-hydroxyacyl-CoA dehydrogenase NAD-binding domain-containing protein n=1 Tax=Aurantimonas sp. Leaf443 TaxID=1736378 RepID=UPI0006F429FD|nr:3-hydroxyacyl-CoA dehydrogenase NAD-binding domain-containing protein [Aurantimonas sp. Leaf443]KQT88049.1 fatty-acid oxidation protein subunit alpha [Aurantimonas sp. Leaf443]
MSLLGALSDRTLELGPAREAEPSGNWRRARTADHVVWLVLDRPGKSVNTIDRSVIEELATHLDWVEAQRPVALVIRSAKPAGFAAGADIAQFTGASKEEIAGMLGAAHGVLDRLAGLSAHTVAVVHGHCLGAGLELALACRHRIAVSGASLGFPEVMLGLHPGLGGTYRSTAVADPLEAMTMMLTGKAMPARKAKAVGLVDAVVEERHVAAAVEAALHGEFRPREGGLKGAALRLRPARRLAAAQMRKSVAARASEAHYPAPYRLIDLWEVHGGDARAMQAAELESFSALVAGETAQNLVRVFFLREAMRGLRKGASGISHVHVVGAGAMGGDIAAWCAREGLRVTVSDVALPSIGRAMKAATRMLRATLKDPLKVRDALDRLVPDPGGLGIAAADLVIEAAPERLELKRRLYAEIEPRLKAGAILATNTSALPLETLAEGLADPARFVGLHFFNPVSRMQLVEIVRHARASDETLRRATAFAVEIGRLPAPVKSAPGFLVNRALTPYMAEALIMVGEGIPKERIDAAAEAFGMPMGPVELADRVGLDIAVEVGASLRRALGADKYPESPAWLTEMVAAGRLGAKAGKGLYDYDGDGKPAKRKLDALPDGAPGDADLTDRLILPMLDAVVACLREGVVESEEIADGAMIFGTGFAPFRGGPLAYARARGIETVTAAMTRLESRLGTRFHPDAGWAALSRP